MAKDTHPELQIADFRLQIERTKTLFQLAILNLQSAICNLQLVAFQQHLHFVGQFQALERLPFGVADGQIGLGKLCP